MLEFGETIMFLRAKSVGKDKYDSRWETGVWIGIREESGEHIIGTETGVLKARSIRRKAREEERWNKQLFDKFQGVPWKPVPGRDGDAIRVRASIPETRPVEKSKQLDVEETSRRRVRITKEMIEKYGITRKCQGCTAINRGIAKQPHNKACRARLEERLKEEGHEGLRRAEERINDQIAEKIEKKDKR